MDDAHIFLYIYSYAKFVEAFQIECIIVGINIVRRDKFETSLKLFLFLSLKSSSSILNNYDKFDNEGRIDFCLQFKALVRREKKSSIIIKEDSTFLFEF